MLEKKHETLISEICNNYFEENSETINVFKKEITKYNIKNEGINNLLFCLIISLMFFLKLNWFLIIIGIVVAFGFIIFYSPDIVYCNFIICVYYLFKVFADCIVRIPYKVGSAVCDILKCLGNVNSPSVLVYEDEIVSVGKLQLFPCAQKSLLY